jgi:excisionase family DNA binding protein
MLASMSISAENPDHLLTVRQACVTLAVSRPTLTEWRRRGLVPFIRVGRSVRIPASGLSAFIAANVEQQPEMALEPPR